MQQTQAVTLDAYQQPLTTLPWVSDHKIAHTYRIRKLLFTEEDFPQWMQARHRVQLIRWDRVFFFFFFLLFCKAPHHWSQHMCF